MKWRTLAVAALSGFGLWQFLRQREYARQVSLRNKVVLITGASSGIGRASARIFAAQGAHIILVARRANLLAEVQSELNQEFDTRILSIATDITKQDEVNHLARTVLDEFGRLDVLVNNAGAVSGGYLEDHDITTWQQIIDTNLTGTVRVTQAFLPLMKMQHSGHIVNVTSISSFTGVPGNAVYSGSKLGVNGFSESLRREVFASGIDVSIVMPGYTGTPMSQAQQVYMAENNLTSDMNQPDNPEYVASNIVAAVRYKRSQVILGGFSMFMLNILYRIFPQILDIFYTRFIDPDEIVKITEQVG